MDASGSTRERSASGPRVFLSHASEDKARFVLEFATRLRARGVDVWLDRWEMYPGDSLVDKIFEEGIKNADAIIVVLSNNSVGKPWVREELNASVVKRLSEGSLLIPVVLDDCDVPEALKTTVWQKIPDLESYADEIDRITAAIFDQREKPPLGSPPRYATIIDRPVGRLSRLDTFILRLFGEQALGSENSIDIDTDAVWDIAAKNNVPRQEFLDSLEVLADQAYLKSSAVLAPVSPYFTLTTHGFDQFARHYVPDYMLLQESVASLIVNENVKLNSEIADRLGQSRTLVTLIMRVFERRQLVRLYEALGGHTEVETVKPQFRRLLRDAKSL